MPCKTADASNAAGAVLVKGGPNRAARSRLPSGSIYKNRHPKQQRKRKQSEADLNKVRPVKYRLKYLQARVRQARALGSAITFIGAMGAFGIDLQADQTWISQAHRLPETKRAIRIRFKALAGSPVRSTESIDPVALSQRKPDQERDPEPTQSSQHTECEPPIGEPIVEAAAEDAEQVPAPPPDARPSTSPLEISAGEMPHDATRKLFHEPAPIEVDTSRALRSDPNGAVAHPRFGYPVEGPVELSDDGGEATEEDGEVPEPNSETKQRDSLSEDDVVTMEAAQQGRLKRARAKARKEEERESSLDPAGSIGNDEATTASTTRSTQLPRGTHAVRVKSGTLSAAAQSPAPKKISKRKRELLSGSTTSSIDIGRSTLPITQNSGVTWNALNAHVRKAAQLLGYHHTTWSAGLSYPPIFDEMWADIPKNAQAALKTLQYKVMDFNKRCSAGRRFIYDREWSTALTQRQRAKAKLLGWTRKKWNDGDWVEVKLHFDSWSSLSKEQKAAAGAIDFTEEKWNMRAATLRSTYESDSPSDGNASDANSEREWQAEKERALASGKERAEGMARASTYRADDDGDEDFQPRSTRSRGNSSATASGSSRASRLETRPFIPPLPKPTIIPTRPITAADPITERTTWSVQEIGSSTSDSEDSMSLSFD